MLINNFLKERREKALVTLNEFVAKANILEDIKMYEKMLKEFPKRTDFINFDKEGFELNDNEPLFKGWEVCEEASSDIIKVAKKDECRLYFDTKDGVIVVNKTNMTDNATYNDLAIFFDGKLELN